MPRESASQAGPSRGRDEAEDAAARRARRQKRREEEAYHVKGWENLYGGGGSKPVFAHDPLPSSKTPRQGQSSSQSPTKSTRDPASSRRRTQSPAKTSNTSSASSSKLPPSTAPPTTRSMTPHASTPRLTKRKASTPSLYTSPNKKSKAAAAAAPTTRRQTAQDSDDSDDDFEITGACGPAATRFSSNVAPASSIKVSPSAVSPLNARRSSSSRRSVSKAPSAGVQSPAAPSLPAQDDGDTLSSASAPASRGASQTRASASSSSRSTPGPAKLTAEEIEALKDNALREYEQGVSLAQHIDNSVRDFTAGLSADHPDLPIVSQFQRKVADLGAQLTIKELRIDIPTLPPRFQKRFAPAVAAYVKYLKREGAQTQGDAVPDNVATSSVRSPDPAQQQAPDKGNSTATLNNDVGHDSAVESVGSPQAFGTPPEQPLDDLDEAATTHPSPPRAASTPTVSKAQEPAEELESNAEEQEARAGSAIPQEADEPEEENELIDELEDDDREGIKSGEQRRSAPAKSSELSTDDPTAEADVEALVTGSADSSSRADAAVAHPPSDKQNLLQTGDANETAPDSRIEGIHQQITQEASDVAERLEHRPTEGSGEEMAPPASNSPPGEGNDGALVTAADQIEGAAAAGGIIQSFTATQQPAADLDGEKVANAVEAVEQALAGDSEVLPESAETSENLRNYASTVVASAQAPNGVAILTNETDAVDDGSSAAATEVVTAAVTATHPAPLQSDANEIASEVQSSEIQTPAEAPDTDAIADAVPIVDAMSQTLAVAVATLPAENAQEAADLPDAAMADTDTGNASARAAESPEHAGSSAEGHGESTAAEVLDQPRALPNLDVAENSVTTDETHVSQRHERASSQTASDAGTGSRAKKTIDDRMKSMLNDLAKVTGRRSSYETVKELKPKRAGLATPRTVQDVVDQWQDPAQMIPWTCLQELGPGIFHKNAHKHMHLSMHELMDKVSSTKAVKHLSDWLPERVMTRALMEFPRVPHMMHCWNEEKRKYFDSRGLAQPKDTKPEFRYADEEEEEEGGVEVRGSTSAPSAGRDGAPGHLAVPDQKPRSASPVMAAAQRQAMTGQPLASHLGQAPRPQPAPVVHPNMSQINVVQLPPRPAPAPQASTQRQHHVQPAPAIQSQPTLQEMFRRVQTTPTAVAPAALAAPAQPAHAQPMGALMNERRAAMLRQATDRVFSGIAADCLSLAEHVIGSPASAELNVRSHFSEADVLHVLDFVVATYRREMEAERAAGSSWRVKAEQWFAKIMRVRDCAMEVLTLTQTLCKVKMCLNDAAADSLRRTGIASSDGWLELLATSPKWAGIRQFLLANEAAAVSQLSGAELRLMLGRQVDLVNKRLEGVLERLMSMDEVVGGQGGGGTEEEAQGAIRKECEQIGRICCKHVVGILVGEGERQS